MNPGKYCEGKENLFSFLSSNRSDSLNRIIIYTSNSVATSKKLYDRRKLIMEELHKLRQARTHNHFVRLICTLFLIDESFAHLDCHQSSII